MAALTLLEARGLTRHFDGLKAVDANLNLRADQIVADKLKIGATAMTVALTGGKLTAMFFF